MSKELIAQLRRDIDGANTQIREVEAVAAEADRRKKRLESKRGKYESMLDQVRGMEDPTAAVRTKPERKKSSGRRAPRRVTDSNHPGYGGAGGVGRESLARIRALFREHGLLTQAQIHEMTGINAGSVTRAMLLLFRADPPEIMPTERIGRSQQWKWLGERDSEEGASQGDAENPPSPDDAPPVEVEPEQASEGTGPFGFLSR